MTKFWIRSKSARAYTTRSSRDCIGFAYFSSLSFAFILYAGRVSYPYHSSLHENKGELSFTFILDSLFHLTTILVSFLSFSWLRPILQTPCYSFVTLFNLVRVTVTLHYHYFYFVALILTPIAAGFTTLCPTTNYTSPPPILSHNRL